MQISPAIAIAFSAIARASRSVFAASAFAAASAKGPPDPIATIPSSGSIKSPVPERRNVEVLSSTTMESWQLDRAAPLHSRKPIAPPVLGKLHGRPFEIAAVLLELRLESREQREG